jgi:Transposase IS66 family
MPIIIRCTGNQNNMRGKVLRLTARCWRTGSAKLVLAKAGIEHLLSPIVEAIKGHVLAQDVLFTDDTPVPVLAPGAGKTKVGRLWTHVHRPAGKPASANNSNS